MIEASNNFIPYPIMASVEMRGWYILPEAGPINDSDGPILTPCIKQELIAYFDEKGRMTKKVYENINHRNGAGEI